jgi:hypothetical protein
MMPGWMSVRNLSRCANEKISPEMRGYYFLFRVERLEQPALGIPARWACRALVNQTGYAGPVLASFDP